MEAVAYRQSAFTRTERQKAQEVRPGGLAWHIQDFDQNPQQHGLDTNWYKFHGIGFLMNAQMNLLPEGAEHDREKREVWTQQTKRDILGFCLEYLSKELVFAYKYNIHTKPDGTQELVDPLYGNRPAVAMVDVKERDGVVRDNMQHIQDFFLDPTTQDGALAIMPSPKGPSGLTTDDGKAIQYLTSFFFVMQKKGDEIVGSTIKTDFTDKEYRAMIQTLTGQELPANAGVTDYVRALALISPNKRRDGIQNSADVVALMRQTKLQERGDDSAFEGRSWDEVYRGIAKGEELYLFNKKTQEYIEEFVAYSREAGHSRLDLQKAVGATLLRISQLFLEQHNAEVINSQLIATNEPGGYSPKGPIPRSLSFGQVFSEVKKIPGCAGGGESGSMTSVLSVGGSKAGQIEAFGKDDLGNRAFSCPVCGEVNVRPYNGTIPTCQHCGSSEVAC